MINEKRFAELKGEIIDQSIFAEQVALKYELGEASYQDVSKEINKLTELGNKINILIGDAVRDVHQRARVTYQKKHPRVAKNIEELGYTP